MAWRGRGEPALGAVKQSLKALDELRATLKDCADLEDRIAKMERDKRLFADEVGAVAAALDLEDAPDEVRAMRRRDRGARRSGARERAPPRGEG